MQVAQRNHVFDALHRGAVHRLDAPLRCQPLFRAIVVFHLDAPPLGRDDTRPNRYIELPARDGLYPDVVTLWEEMAIY